MATKTRVYDITIIIVLCSFSVSAWFCGEDGHATRLETFFLVNASIVYAVVVYYRYNNEIWVLYS